MVRRADASCKTLFTAVMLIFLGRTITRILPPLILRRRATARAGTRRPER
jgi:hypothetical protein